MKSKKVKIGIIIGIIILIIVIVVISLILNNKETDNAENTINNEESTNNSNTILEETVEPQTEEEKQKIEEIKNESGLTADTNIYEVQKEYDGREVLVVKDSVQYRVELAGILNNGLPEKDKVEKILQNRPQKTGIWISEPSRDKFLEYLKETTKNNYIINQEGYLQIEQESNEKTEQDQLLEKYISNNKQYIIDISGIFYQVDNVTGEIVEYPFEKMDGFQAYEYSESNGNIIMALTTNKDRKIQPKEIIESMLELFESYA